LRKELIRTEMRIRQKNKFFQRLSAIGDQIFPKRKDLIKEVSQKFCDDVDAFIAQHFQEEQMQDSLFMLREEIKVLQNIAKVITLNTHAFKHSRMCLSKCWDELKHLDKERKKVRAQQKATHRKNAEPLLQALAELTEVAEKAPVGDMQQKLDEINEQMQAIELGRDEVKYLRDKISTIRRILITRLRESEMERSNQMLEKERQRKAKVCDLKKAISDLTSALDRYDVEELSAQREALSAQINDLPGNKQEKLELERTLKPVRDAITEKRERSLLALSEDDRNALQQLKEILKQRKERRVEINNQLELFRKSEVASGLDFEKAMSYSEQIAAEKKRLEKISAGIKEVEEKIAQLEGKI
jgi:DNA repair exonuclease SbcCD ATPase subunit